MCCVTSAMNFLSDSLVEIRSHSISFIEALLMDVKFEANVNEWFPFSKKNPSTSQKNLLDKQKERKKFNNNELDKTTDKMRR